MALELIDYLLYFWCLLGGAIYLLGEAFEKQLRGRLLAATTAGGSKTRRQSQDFWTEQPSSGLIKDRWPDQQTQTEQSITSRLNLRSQVEAEPIQQAPRSQSYSHLGSSTIPTATGFNADCVDWVNQILYLFYSQANKYGPMIRENVNRSLNEKISYMSSSSAELSELSIEFSSPPPDWRSSSSQSWPQLTNVRTESESEKSISAQCKIYCHQIAFELTIRPLRQLQGGVTIGQRQEQQYELVLDNLEGKLKSIAMLNDRLLVVQFIEKPDSKISLRPIRSPSETTPMIHEDRLVALILQAISSVVVDLYFGDDPEFPLYVQQTSSANRNKLSLLRASASELKRQIKHDFLGALSNSGSNNNKTDKKLLVKLLAAKNINYNQTVVCLLELATPKQVALSSTKQGSNPTWDEHFLFQLVDKLGDNLTLSLWDSPSGSANKAGQPVSSSQDWLREFSGKSLGRARVSIDSLRRAPSQKLSLPLESMGDEPSESVGGELILELLYLEHESGSLPRSPSASSLQTAEPDVVSVERKLTTSGYVITTTTIVKPKHMGRLEVALQRNPSPISSNHSELELLRTAGNQSPAMSEAPVTAPSPSGRSRSRSRSLLRAIKKRFSFSRTRSRSVGGTDGEGSQRNLADGCSTPDLSVERNDGRARSVPPPQRELPAIVINKGRMSDATSALSLEPQKSQLVIECQETNLDGKEVVRHFALADSQRLAKKLRKRGSSNVKLHLFNEHQFVAARLASSSTCHMCSLPFSLRPGKQGYRCRNCHLLAHKQCHIKVDHNCPYADRLELEYIDAEPPQSLIRDRANSSSTLARPIPARPRLGAKSVSVDVDVDR